MAVEDGRELMAALRVLVVDDDEIARSSIVNTLEDIGCAVTSCADAEKAVSVFVSGSFDLIMLDHRMPGLNGMELHKVLSQEFGAGKRTTGFAVRSLPPTVIATAYAEDPEVVRWQYGESIAGVLQKPFARETLRRIVDDLSERLAGSGVCLAQGGAPRLSSHTQ